MATAHFCFDLVKTEVIKNQPFLLQTCRYMQFRRCQNKRKVKIESKWTGLFLGKWTGLNLSKISVEKFANWSFVWKKGGKKIQRKLESNYWEFENRFQSWRRKFETMTFEFCRLNQTDFVEFSATEFHALLQPETWF